MTTQHPEPPAPPSGPAALLLLGACWRVPKRCARDLPKRCAGSLPKLYAKALARACAGGVAGLALMLAALIPQAPAAKAQDLLNDYPTEARAEYVFACMAANGQTQDMLRRCACSIDIIATILPYSGYVSAETVMRMRFAGGEQGAMFRGAPAMRALVADLRRAQAEAEILCF